VTGLSSPAVKGRAAIDVEVTYVPAASAGAIRHILGERPLLPLHFYRKYRIFHVEVKGEA
jgi:hypothetical protein